MERLARFVYRRHLAVLAVTLCIAALAGWRAARLSLRTDFAELLPEKDPAVVVMREMTKRITGLSTVVVAVEGPSPEANRRYVDDLVPRLQQLGLPEIKDVEWGVQPEREFFRKNKFLYASVAQLEDARDTLRQEILKRKNPAYVKLDDDAGDGGGDLSSKRQEMDQKESELLDKFPDGYFATKDRQLYAVLVRSTGSLFGEHSGEKLIGEVRKVVASLDPRAYHPEMKVGLTGDIVTALEERRALEDDLVMATSVCVVLVCLAIFLFYGRLRAVPLSVVPAIMGYVCAMGFAQLAFGYLNSSTAFMGSIIVGNGINYAIIQMARYDEERRTGRSVEQAIVIALTTTWRGTAVAALGAAVAYGSLAITGFRGFNQFGYIGGVGMILSWIFTIVVLPAVWALLDRRAVKASRVPGFAAGGLIAKIAVRRPVLLAVLGSAVTLAALVPLPRYLRDPFEYDFRNLRNQVSNDRGSGRLSGKVDQIFGRALSPNFIVADDPSEVEEIRQELRRRDEKTKILGDIRTINDFVPGTEAEQHEKLVILADIRKLIDNNTKLLDEKEKADAERLRPPDGLVPVRPIDVPISVRRYFTETDGTIGRPVAYYLKEKGISTWDGHALISLAHLTREVRLPDGRTVRSSGSATVFAGMLEAIAHDGPIATAAAFLAVSLLVIALTWKRGGTGLILGVLVVGVLWMIGAAASAHVKVNFLNFIALPITFGIGVDYGVNLYLRYQLEGPGRVGPAVAATGAAVALASLTTIIGYGALLVADNRALRSFGSMAILGEFACLTAALVLMPAVLLILERRQAKHAAAPVTAAPPPPAKAAGGAGSK
jgi:predicted RND superfamily exporter protein